MKPEQDVSEQPNMGVMHLSKFFSMQEKGGLDKDLCSVELM